MNTFVEFLNKKGIEVRIGKHSQHLSGHYAALQGPLDKVNKKGWYGVGHGHTPKEALVEALLLYFKAIKIPSSIEEYGEIN